MASTTTIEFRVLFASGESEFITTTAGNDTAAMREALRAAGKRHNRDGSRDHVTLIEFWARRA